jgi:hypothetical protein
VIGEVKASAAGRDMVSVHNDLAEMGKILALFTDTVTGWQEREEVERRQRQRDNDIRFALIESGIKGMRNQMDAIRESLRWLRWLTIVVVCVLTIIVIRLWPALTVLALAR